MTKNSDTSPWMQYPNDPKAIRRHNELVLSSIPTLDLVAELAMRDGVTQLIVDTDDCAFSCYAGPNNDPRWVNQCYGNGPAKILVVRE